MGRFSCACFPLSVRIKLVLSCFAYTCRRLIDLTMIPGKDQAGAFRAMTAFGGQVRCHRCHVRLLRDNKAGDGIYSKRFETVRNGFSPQTQRKNTLLCTCSFIPLQSSSDLCKSRCTRSHHWAQSNQTLVRQEVSSLDLLRICGQEWMADDDRFQEAGNGMYFLPGATF